MAGRRALDQAIDQVKIEKAQEELETNIAGFNVKIRNAALIAAFTIVSGSAGAIWAAAEFYGRITGLEESITEFSEGGFETRIANIEQSLSDNDISKLQGKLSEIGANMATILEQQKTLLDLRSKVERAELLTDGIDQKLQRLQDDIDSTWDAIDALEKPL